MQKPSRDPFTKEQQQALENDDDLLQKEEIMWKQRSRADWMAEGDRNTGFFHRVAEGRKKRNNIREITRADGLVTRKNQEMDEVFKEHFQTLFTAGDFHNPAEVLRSIEPMVTDDMNEVLTTTYTHEEVVQALKQMPPLKAPGPDGMPVIFYSSCWATVKFDVVPMILSILNEGRHITDNALLAFEIFHMMKLNKAKAHGVFAFKLDMAKAYDRVEWSFLESMMRRLGFHFSVVDLIMRCVSTVSFRVLVNGFPGDQFEPGRGLRQGDPLSPFLFLFCAEALSSLLRRAETQNMIHGARICRSAPRVSHLLFADDCIIFGRANADEIRRIRDIIGDYEHVSGQKVNLEKSSISFSSGVGVELRGELAGLLGVQYIEQGGRYLGIPSTVGRSKTEIFQMLVDRTRKKSKDWKRRFLSSVGKVVLIKAVLQAIPSYLMSCFVIPEQICQNLNGIAARFFWGQKQEERRIHWKSWKSLCVPKKEWGLGFRDLSLFNRAMLAKQVWRIIQNDSSLLARSLKARYFPRTDILLASRAHNPSYIWTSLLAGRDLLNEGVAWKIGDGSRIRIGHDAWLPDGEGRFHVARVGENLRTMKVSDLFLEDGEMWDLEKVQEIAYRAVWAKPISIPNVQNSPCQVECSRRGQFKIRCDAAFASGVGMAFGVVISDAEGKKAGCCYGFRPGVVSVMEGEATAVLEGVRLCTEKGLSDVIIEMDCQRLY
ncbi:uncharacterized protein LOC131004671 [Salvia miltiorrhiza]|uniref:uncharacterized protein LOC131004671 n=1 Tax=Salvia miltiorrhiza TaxID=226208 RepID=UPI0025AD3142|nr:uncharacterized protein LOC131004671 [Salvia miltiorrhiza]